MKRLFLATATGLLMALNASATVIVDFTPPSDTVNSRNANNTSTTGDTWDFSASEALLTGGTGGQNTTVYGGLKTTWGTTVEPFAPNFRYNSGNLQLQITTGAAVDRTATGIYLWNQADFLNGGNVSPTVSFESGDSLSLTFGGFGSTNREMRFVVNQGGTYYVSNTNKTTVTTSAFTIDPTTTTWAQINTSTYAIGSYSSLTLDDVQGVGIYFTGTATTAGQQLLFTLTDFQANATLVPEPTSLGLLGLGGLGALLRRRRSK